MGKRPLGRADKVKPSPPETAPDAGPKLANMEEKWSFKQKSSVTSLTLNTDNTYRCHCLLFLIDLSNLVLPKIASVQLAPNVGEGGGTMLRAAPWPDSSLWSAICLPAANVKVEVLI